VVDDIRSRRLEVQPARVLFLAGLVHQPDLSGLASARDPAADVIAGERPLDPIFQPFGVLRLEAHPDQRLKVVAHLLTDLAVARADDLHVLDHVARVHVALSSTIARARRHEDHMELAVRSLDRPNRCDVPRVLGLDACRELLQIVPVQRSAGELRDLRLEPGTEPREIETRDLSGGDDGPFGGLGVLGGRHVQRHRQKRE
jgi:hypothetical protein